MLLIQCITAYTAVLALSEQEMNYETALALVVLKKRLAPHVEFFAGKERALIDEYGKRDDAGKLIRSGQDGFVLDETKDLREYAARRAELSATNVPEDFEPLHAPSPQQIKPAHLEALEGFICFDERSAT